jgi:hypothetical protein
VLVTTASQAVNVSEIKNYNFAKPWYNNLLIDKRAKSLFNENRKNFNMSKLLTDHLCLKNQEIFMKFLK